MVELLIGRVAPVSVLEVGSGQATVRQWRLRVRDGADPGTVRFEARRVAAAFRGPVRVFRAASPTPAMRLSTAPRRSAPPSRTTLLRLSAALTGGRAAGLDPSLRITAVTLRGRPAALYVTVRSRRPAAPARALAPLARILPVRVAWIIRVRYGTAVVRTTWHDATADGGADGGRRPPVAVSAAIDQARLDVPDLAVAFGASPAASDTLIGYGRRTLRIERPRIFWFGEDLWRVDLLDALAAQTAALGARAGLPRPTRLVTVVDTVARPPSRPIPPLARPWTSIAASRLAARLNDAGAQRGLTRPFHRYGVVVMARITLPAPNRRARFAALVGALRDTIARSGTTNPVVITCVVRDEPIHSWWRLGSGPSLREGSGDWGDGRKE